MSDKTERADAVCTAIERAIGECGIISIRELPKFEQAIRMAKGIREMRLALNDEFVKHALMPLQGSTLGFLTDKDKNKDGSPGPGYPLATVRECAIEAMIRGFNVVGNEFNIIAERFYGTKNGYSRQVLEFRGLRDLVLEPGVAHIAGERGALVPYTATWKLDGKEMRIDCQQLKDGPDQRIPVKINAGMGQDAILGKAERKMLFRIYQRLLGSAYGATDGEVGEEPITTTGEPAPSPVQGAVDGRRYSIGKKTNAAAAERSDVPDGGAGASHKGPASAAAAADKSKTNGAAQAKEHTETPTPASAVSSPAAAPADYTAGAIPISSAPAQATPVDLVELHETLAEATDDWSFRGASKVLSTWTEAQRVKALAWATAVVTDGSMAIQSNRPIHTLVGRQPGDD
jgi:hypothetical protein